MVGVLDVLEVELPVARQDLAVAPEHFHRRLHHAPDPRRDLRADVALEGRRRLRQRGKHEPAEIGHAELARSLAPRLGVLGHAALPLHAAPERNTGEVAREVVGPVVIDAGDLLRVAAVRKAKERAAVRAAVLEAADRAGFVARHHHRHLADESSLEVALLRQLGLEAEEVPGVAAVDALLLAAVDVLVLVYPVGNAGQSFGGPGA